MNSDIAKFFLIALASYFIGFEFVTKQGPGGVFGALRRAAEIKSRWFGEYLTCPVCMAILPALIFWLLPDSNIKFGLLLWLGSLGLVTIIHFWLWSQT